MVIERTSGEVVSPRSRRVRWISQTMPRYWKECQALTGHTASQVAALTKHLGVDSLAKDKLRDMLRDPAISPGKKKVLRLRQEYAKASIAKINAFLRHQVDGRIHDGIIYGGADRTLRWSGRGI